VLRIYRLLQPTENVAWMDRRDVETEFSGKSLKIANFWKIFEAHKSLAGKTKGKESVRSQVLWDITCGR